MSKRGKVPPQRPGKAGGKRARNRQQRTDALIEAGLQLFLERGVENVPIDDIAREAGMAKGNFYRYFDDKGALVDAILGDVAADVRTAMRKCAVSLGRAETSAEMNDAYATMAQELAVAAYQVQSSTALLLQPDWQAGGAGDFVRHCTLVSVTANEAVLALTDPAFSSKQTPSLSLFQQLFPFVRAWE